MTDLQYLAASALLALFMLVLASLLVARAWTPAGAQLALGNREAMPTPSALAGRAQRAAQNMLEGLLLFTALVAAVRLGGEPASASAAALFFWSRVAYFGVYLAGLRYVRTAIWTVSLFALAQIAAEAF